MPNSGELSPAFLNLLAMVRHMAETFVSDDATPSRQDVVKIVEAMGEGRPLDSDQTQTLRRFRDIVSGGGNEGQIGALAQFTATYERLKRGSVPPQQMVLSELESSQPQNQIFAPTDSAGRTYYFEHPILTSQVLARGDGSKQYTIYYSDGTKPWVDRLDGGQRVHRLLYQGRLFTLQEAEGRPSLPPFNPPARYREREIFSGSLETSAFLLSVLHQIGLVEGEVVWVENIGFTGGTPLEIDPNKPLRGFFLQFNGKEEWSLLKSDDMRLSENPELARTVYGNVIRTIKILKALGIEPCSWAKRLQYNINTGAVSLKGSTLPILVDGRALEGALADLPTRIASIPVPSEPSPYIPNLKLSPSEERETDEEWLASIIRLLANFSNAGSPTLTGFTLQTVGDFMEFASFSAGDKSRRKGKTSSSDTLKERVGTNRTEIATAIGRYIETAWDDLQNTDTDRLAMRALRQFLRDELPRRIVREMPEMWSPFAKLHAMGMGAIVRLKSALYSGDSQVDPSIAAKIVGERAQDILTIIAREYARRFKTDGIDRFMQRVLTQNVILREGDKAWEQAAQDLMDGAAENMATGRYETVDAYWVAFLKRGGLGLIRGGGGPAPETPPDGSSPPPEVPPVPPGGSPPPVASRGFMEGRPLRLVPVPAGSMGVGARCVFGRSHGRGAARRAVGRLTRRTAQRMRFGARGVHPRTTARARFI